MKVKDLLEEVRKTNTGIFSSKFGTALKAELLTIPEKGYTTGFFNEAFDKVMDTATCEFDKRKGHVLYNNMLLCKKCYANHTTTHPKLR